MMPNSRGGSRSTILIRLEKGFSGWNSISEFLRSFCFSASFPIIRATEAFKPEILKREDYFSLRVRGHFCRDS